MAVHRPIVVGVDGSPTSLQAAAWAAMEATRRMTPLTLITSMFMPGGYGIPVGLPDSFFEDEEREAEKRLAAAAHHVAQSASPSTLTIETVICQGPPARELVERSKTAFMVVIGANQGGPIERAFLGSVSGTVVTHAHCPVAVIRSLPEIGINDLSGPIVVGVDGSKHSEHAITVAFEEAALRNTQLVAVSAWSDVEVHAPFSGDVDWTTIENRERAVLSESLAGRAEGFPDVQVRPIVVMDQPARYLREQAERAQLLVVGSRGRGGFVGMLLGSTTRALLHTASMTCPLLVVR
ncbi:universal stress protein [Rhodococcus pyridinivorans KG-16]|uniref:Universal stress protein n=1 Tax=Rhodococcus pyridinivorans KG-16 TaxID=1441730 RepID=A0A0V9UDD1_9NOCA|nr:universal stress protein [Rhodococcus pyridinivorans]KSZ56114.1 universal stress protein [Rhodococcus pyridinivorans KG-16]